MVTLEVPLPSVSNSFQTHLKYSHVHHVGSTCLLPSNKQHYGHIAALFSDVTDMKFARRVMERTVGFDNYVSFHYGRCSWVTMEVKNVENAQWT